MRNPATLEMENGGTAPQSLARDAPNWGKFFGGLESKHEVRRVMNACPIPDAYCCGGILEWEDDDALVNLEVATRHLTTILLTDHLNGQSLSQHIDAGIRNAQSPLSSKADIRCGIPGFENWMDYLYNWIFPPMENGKRVFPEKIDEFDILQTLMDQGWVTLGMDCVKLCWKPRYGFKRADFDPPPPDPFSSGLSSEISKSLGVDVSVCLREVTLCKKGVSPPPPTHKLDTVGTAVVIVTGKFNDGQVHVKYHDQTTDFDWTQISRDSDGPISSRDSEGPIGYVACIKGAEISIGPFKHDNVAFMVFDIITKSHDYFWNFSAHDLDRWSWRHQARVSHERNVTRKQAEWVDFKGLKVHDRVIARIGGDQARSFVIADQERAESVDNWVADVIQTLHHSAESCLPPDWGQDNQSDQDDCTIAHNRQYDRCDLPVGVMLIGRYAVGVSADQLVGQDKVLYDVLTTRGYRCKVLPSSFFKDNETTITTLTSDEASVFPYGDRWSDRDKKDAYQFESHSINFFKLRSRGYTSSLVTIRNDNYPDSSDEEYRYNRHTSLFGSGVALLVDMSQPKDSEEWRRREAYKLDRCEESIRALLTFDRSHHDLAGLTSIEDQFEFMMKDKEITQRLLAAVSSCRSLGGLREVIDAISPWALAHISLGIDNGHRDLLRAIHQSARAVLLLLCTDPAFCAGEYPTLSSRAAALVTVAQSMKMWKDLLHELGNTCSDHVTSSIFSSIILAIMALALPGTVESGKWPEQMDLARKILGPKCASRALDVIGDMQVLPSKKDERACVEWRGSFEAIFKVAVGLYEENYEWRCVLSNQLALLAECAELLPISAMPAEIMKSATNTDLNWVSDFLTFEQQIDIGDAAPSDEVEDDDDFL